MLGFWAIDLHSYVSEVGGGGLQSVRVWGAGGQELRVVAMSAMSTIKRESGAECI